MDDFFARTPFRFRSSADSDTTAPSLQHHNLARRLLLHLPLPYVLVVDVHDLLEKVFVDKVCKKNSTDNDIVGVAGGSGRIAEVEEDLGGSVRAGRSASSPCGWASRELSRSGVRRA